MNPLFYEKNWKETHLYLSLFPSSSPPPKKNMGYTHMHTNKYFLNGRFADL